MIVSPDTNGQSFQRLSISKNWKLSILELWVFLLYVISYISLTEDDSRGLPKNICVLVWLFGVAKVPSGEDFVSPWTSLKAPWQIATSLWIQTYNINIKSKVNVAEHYSKQWDKRESFQVIKVCERNLRQGWGTTRISEIAMKPGWPLIETASNVICK